MEFKQLCHRGVKNKEQIINIAAIPGNAVEEGVNRV